MRHPSQRIAETEAKLARLKDQNRRQDTRQKILIGAVVLAEAKRSAGFRTWLIARLEAALKPADAGAIRKLIEQLQHGEPSHAA